MYTRIHEASPETTRMAEIIRSCVHCGFCLPTCPSYHVLRDERDSPRGRIYLIKDLIENGGQPDHPARQHLDRCLTCHACETACPAGVSFTELAARANRQLEAVAGSGGYKFRRLLVAILTRPPLVRVLAGVGALLKAAGLKRLPSRFAGAGFALLPGRQPDPGPLPGAMLVPGFRSYHPSSKQVVALMAGCVQQGLAPHLNALSAGLLMEAGYSCVVPEKSLCCGALAEHSGLPESGRRQNDKFIQMLRKQRDDRGVTAVISNATGCGAFVQKSDLPGGMRHLDLVQALVRAGWRPDARRSAMVRDAGLTVGFHVPCTLRHSLHAAGCYLDLFHASGFKVETLDESDLCCGSAGLYNVLQPGIADQLGAAVSQRMQALQHCDVFASANLGCMRQIAEHCGRQVVHALEIFAFMGADWSELERDEMAQDVQRETLRLMFRRHFRQ